MRQTINNSQFDEERALYYAQHTDLLECVFAGAQDGESALKEAIDITLNKCSFSLRYPLWHVKGFTMQDTIMDEQTRAAIWYAENGCIKNSRLYGIKAVRECEHISLEGCDVNSMEFGWKSRDIRLTDSRIQSEYLFMDSKDVCLDRVHMKGKYSFQYMENHPFHNYVLQYKFFFFLL